MLLHDTPLTFLFTDIVGSTRMWQRNREGMQQALEIHDQAVRDQVGLHGGQIFAGGGDGFGLVFSNPSAAVEVALGIQTALADLTAGGEPLRIRMGIHTGIAQQRDDDYFGLAVNRAARLTSAANGGQVLVSAASIGQLESLPTTLLGTYRLPDLLEPMEIHQLGSEGFPPIRALDPERHNLPERYTSLIGREGLVDDLLATLRDHRLVTLIGPGGIGKTSVAVDCGARLASISADSEVWFAELDQLVSNTDVEPMVASLFGLVGEDGWQRNAARRPALLILDNAEHLIDDVAATAAGLLRSGPAIRILATSREPLQIPGERVVDVPPLSLDGEATHLLIERSGAQVPESLITDLVNSTDGVPLALELVASHISLVPAESLIESLRDHGISSLSARGVVDRHRTTSNAIQWSYDLLTPDEQRTFRALTVFARAFSLQAAATVGGAPTHSVISLVERSLVHRVGDRFRLLAPIKEFAHHRLDEAGEMDSVIDRKVDFVISEIAEIAERLGPRDGEAWEQETTVDREDILEAATWLIDRQDLGRLEMLYRGLPGQWGLHRHQLNRGMETLDRALPLMLENAGDHRWALFRHAWCLDLCSREPDAEPIVERLIAEADAVDDEYLKAACHALQFRILSIDPAVEPVELERLQALANVFGERSDWWEPDGFLFGRGQHASSRGDYRLAKELIEASNTGQAKSEFNRTLYLMELAECNRMLGNARQALEQLEAIVDPIPALRFSIEQRRAHTLIALGRLADAYESVMRLIALDIEDAGEETTDPFCAGSDYLRAIGDHQAAALMLSNMLNDREPWDPVHRRIMEECRGALGADFDAVWERGRRMTPSSLHALLREQA
jgi:predicted ATPase/class 3 adenylate cyclase